MNKPTSTKEILARAAVIGIAIHVGVALTALLLPGASRLSKVFKIYNRYILSGPYFTNETVKSSHHLYVGYKSNGEWVGEKDYSQDDFEHYCRSPWRYDKLHLRRYPLYLAWQIGLRDHKSENVCASENLVALKKFSVQQWIGQRVDSVSFSYRSRTFDVASSTYSIDTIFSVKCYAK